MHGHKGLSQTAPMAARIRERVFMTEVEKHQRRVRLALYRLDLLLALPSDERPKSDAPPLELPGRPLSEIIREGRR